MTLVSFQPANEMMITVPLLSDSIGSDPITNYPDPFCGITTIEYEVAEASMVSIMVSCPNLSLDILVFEFQEAGTYTVQYDACNKPCGCYIAIFNAGDIHEQEVMTKIRSTHLPSAGIE